MGEYKKYMIAVPCMDNIPTPSFASFVNMRRVGACKISLLSNSLVYDARQMLGAEALDTGADRILWLDSDMVFDADMMECLAEDLDRGLDFVCALYFKRRFPTSPLIYKEIEMNEDSDGKLHAITNVYTDYPKDSLFECAGAGFGAVMCSAKLLRDVFENYGFPFFPMAGLMGEDLAFCWRARQLGYKLYCDSRIKVRHVGLFEYGEQLYARP